MSTASEQKPTEEVKNEQKEQKTQEINQKTEPIRIERKDDPDKIKRRKEKQREASRRYKAKLKEREKQGDEVAIRIRQKNRESLQKLTVEHKKTVDEYRELKKNEANEKKQILEEANKKIEELKAIQVSIPEKVTIKEVVKELPENIVSKEKYKKLKQRVNKLETELQGKKPAFRKDIYDRLFNI